MGCLFRIYGQKNEKWQVYGVPWGCTLTGKVCNDWGESHGFARHSMSLWYRHAWANIHFEVYCLSRCTLSTCFIGKTPCRLTPMTTHLCQLPEGSWSVIAGCCNEVPNQVTDRTSSPSESSSCGFSLKHREGVWGDTRIPFNVESSSSKVAILTLTWRPVNPAINWTQQVYKKWAQTTSLTASNVKILATHPHLQRFPKLVQAIYIRRVNAQRFHQLHSFFNLRLEGRGWRCETKFGKVMDYSTGSLK